MVRYFTVLFILIGLFAYSGCASSPVDRYAEVCRYANSELCPDLRLKVEFERDPDLYIKQGAYAHASVYSSGRCVIRYVSESRRQRHLIHELNHCRGWDHKDLGDVFDSTWHPSSAARLLSPPAKGRTKSLHNATIPATTTVDRFVITAKPRVFVSPKIQGSIHQLQSGKNENAE